MKTKITLASLLFLFIGCGMTKENLSIFEHSLDYGSPNVEQELISDDMLRISVYSSDSTYGYVQENPIMSGGGIFGVVNERRFLNVLTGPNGEKVTYNRLGSCCRFKSKNGINGKTGFLDMYNVKYDGLEEGVTLYINIYDSDTLRVPVGFGLIYDYKIEEYLEIDNNIEV